MARDTNFLTKQEKILCNEIIRVSDALKKGSLGLTGTQYRTFCKMKNKTEYRDQFEKKISHIEIFSTEERKRHKKKDMIDMFKN